MSSASLPPLMHEFPTLRSWSSIRAQELMDEAQADFVLASVFIAERYASAALAVSRNR